MPLLLRKHLGTAAVLEPSEQITIEYHVSCSLNGPKVSLAHFFPVPIRKNNMFLHFLASTCTLSN